MALLTISSSYLFQKIYYPMVKNYLRTANLYHFSQFYICARLSYFSSSFQRILSYSNYLFQSTFCTSDLCPLLNIFQRKTCLIPLFYLYRYSKCLKASMILVACLLYCVKKCIFFYNAKTMHGYIFLESFPP